ncbi:nicotinamidase-related amidase [Sphingobium sp. B11D3B]|uniref:cysteine hydrolase family protein n=1 Tax=Sphingobium sp. B11D3B TaxID=2940575 RepID=UPI002227A7B3|nr:cysteine hydrolase family protein [Sphingobium sp. B11D3B]MCW2388932.1 nicotinamidase-related amidase [Sphingobium sp. B11D3B]
MPDQTAPYHRLGSSPRRAWQVNAQEAILAQPEQPRRVVACAAAPQNLQIDLARTAIVVVDMQNDFCHPDGWLASIGVDISAARSPITPLQALLPRLRDEGVPVVWLNWGNRPDQMNLSPSILHVYKPDGTGTGLGDPLANGAPVLEEGSWAAAVVDELPIASQDICVSKYRMSGFWDTPLDSILRNLRVDTVLFAGVNSDQCVLATLIDANCLGYDCVLLTDCAATTSPAFCAEATLYNVKQCFGFATDSSALIAGLDAVAGQERA